MDNGLCNVKLLIPNDIELKGFKQLKTKSIEELQARTVCINKIFKWISYAPLLHYIDITSFTIFSNHYLHFVQMVKIQFGK